MEKKNRRYGKYVVERDGANIIIHYYPYWPHLGYSVSGVVADIGDTEKLIRNTKQRLWKEALELGYVSGWKKNRQEEEWKQEKR